MREKRRAQAVGKGGSQTPSITTPPPYS